MRGTEADTNRDSRPRRRWGCWFAPLLVALALTTGYGFLTGYLPIQAFDAEKWRQVRSIDNHARLRMVEWLVRSGELDGLNRAQLLELLGQPDGGPYFEDWSLVYWLGPERGLMGMDSEWLVLRIGPDGRVAEYRVMRD